MFAVFALCNFVCRHTHKGLKDRPHFCRKGGKYLSIFGYLSYIV